jgi:hypothetical protein
VTLELACDTPACFGPLKSSDEDEYEDDEPKMHLSAFERTAVIRKNKHKTVFLDVYEQVHRNALHE